MSNQATLWATDTATSSPASAAGPMPCASLTGQTISPSGPEAAPVNLSARQAKVLGLLTSGTSGPPSSGSSRSVALATSVANRLRQAMRFDGGILWRLTWKGRATPARRWIYQRQASARRTSGADCSGWPTPVANDDNKTPEAHLAMKLRMGERDGTGSQRIAITSLQVMAQTLSSWPTPVREDSESNGGHRGRPDTLHSATQLSAWPTPNTPSGGRSVSTEQMDATGRTLDGKKHTASLEHAVKFTPWPTPNTSNSTGAGEHGDGGQNLQTTALSAWPTPVTTDAVGAGGRNETAQKDGSKTHAGTSLTDAAMAAVGWTTPSARDWKDSAGMAQTGTNPDGTERMRLDQLPRQAALTHGPTLSGSPAQTGKRGQLNPGFSRFLMNYPISWDIAAMRVERGRSLRSSRKPPTAPGVSEATETP